MSDSLVKRVEIVYRRFLIRLLSRFVHRSTLLPANIDYNNCKYLFVRQDLIGDVLVSTPLYSILKDKYPLAIIDVLLSKNNHFVLENDPLIRKRWLYEKSLSAAFKMVLGIRRERYDFVIDLMDNPSATSTMLCLFSGAQWTVGLEKENSFVYDIRVPMLSRSDTHILDRIIRLLEPFNIDITKQKIAVRYYTSVKSRDLVNAFLMSLGLSGKEIIGINISAGSEVRFWGIHNFRKLVHYLIANYPESHPIVLYKPAHRAKAEEIVKDFQGCTLSNMTESFDEYAALIERCKFLITPDTSAVHLAAAFKIPVVVLYVQSNKDLNIWSPYGVDHEALIADIDNLKSIPEEKVCAAFTSLYTRTSR